MQPIDHEERMGQLQQHVRLLDYSAPCSNASAERFGSYSHQHRVRFCQFIARCRIAYN